MDTPTQPQTPVRIIITGGTFDKQYDEIRGELTFRETHLPGILEKVHCHLTVFLEINQLVDSLEMLEENRRSILDSCRSVPESHIVITHGTDTMDKTARLISEAKLEKTIVLTGAMVPYTLRDSDALFNLGAALSAVQLLPPGVYVAMGGQIFPGDQVVKDKERGRFLRK